MGAGRDTARAAERMEHDDELMRRAAAGDREAFRLLVERWEQPVYAFLCRMLGSPEEALDLRQETFLRVHQQAGRYRAQGQFRSWLFRIAGNLARSALRRRRILKWLRLDPQEHDRPADQEPADRALERQELQAAVRAAIAELPARQREALVLRRYQELSQREIAAALGTTEEGVESLLGRAMSRLRRTLAAQAGAAPGETATGARPEAAGGARSRQAIAASRGEEETQWDTSRN